MQGIKPFIPTERKVAYIQSLLRDWLNDFGSFVSKSDSANAGYTAVLGQLDLSQTKANYWLLLQYQRSTNGFEHAEINT
jgi:hydroxymethylglutaryl-CoA lyase